MSVIFYGVVLCLIIIVLSLVMSFMVCAILPYIGIDLEIMLLHHQSILLGYFLCIVGDYSNGLI